MKKYSVFVLIAVVSLMLSFKPKETELKWYNWNEGYDLAHKKGKLVLVDVYTSWCGWCKKMDHDTYTNGDILAQIDKDFVPVKLNPEDKSISYKVQNQTLTGPQLLSALTNGQANGYPTIVIMNPKIDQVIIAQAGYQDVPQFKKTLESAVATKGGN